MGIDDDEDAEHGVIQLLRPHDHLRDALSHVVSIGALAAIDTLEQTAGKPEADTKLDAHLDRLAVSARRFVAGTIAATCTKRAEDHRVEIFRDAVRPLCFQVALTDLVEPCDVLELGPGEESLRRAGKAGVLRNEVHSADLGVVFHTILLPGHCGRGTEHSDQGERHDQLGEHATHDTISFRGLYSILMRKVH